MCFGDLLGADFKNFEWLNTLRLKGLKGLSGKLF